MAPGKSREERPTATTPPYLPPRRAPAKSADAFFLSTTMAPSSAIVDRSGLHFRAIADDGCAVELFACRRPPSQLRQLYNRTPFEIDWYDSIKSVGSRVVATVLRNSADGMNKNKGTRAKAGVGGSRHSMIQKRSRAEDGVDEAAAAAADAATAAEPAAAASSSPAGKSAPPRLQHCFVVGDLVEAGSLRGGFSPSSSLQWSATTTSSFPFVRRKMKKRHSHTWTTEALTD